MRQKVGLTQIQLAKQVGVSQSLITKVEKGKIEPSYTIARKIFIVLEEELAKQQKETIAKNICTKNIAYIKADHSIDESIRIMKKYAISQIPVKKDGAIIGSISEETFIKNYEKIKNKHVSVEEIMDEPFPTIPEDTHISLIRDILKTYPAIILLRKGKPSGIITKADILKRL
jgi:predicted transcriptional regulator